MWLKAGVGVALLVSSTSSTARPEYVDFIPSAPADGRCATCHASSMGAGPRNVFGADVEGTITQDGPDWSSLFCLDSDGDGVTNGQELGDPCGIWTPGTPPLRTDPLSAPADPQDHVNVDDSAACAGQPAPSCSALALASNSGCAQCSPLSAGFVALAIFLRRRRAP